MTSTTAHARTQRGLRASLRRLARSVREVLAEPDFDPDLPRLRGYPFGTTPSRSNQKGHRP